MQRQQKKAEKTDADSIMCVQERHTQHEMTSQDSLPPHSYSEANQQF